MTRGLLFITLFAALAGCRANESTPVRIDLIEHLPVADVAFSRAELPAESAAGVEDGTLRQTFGTVITYYFPLPAKARLRGRAFAEVGEAQAGAGRITVELIDGAGEPKSLLAEPTSRAADPGGLELDADLSASSDRMAGIRIAVTGEAGPRLAWRELWIEGEGSAPLPPPPDVRGRYNVLLIVFDTLRADRTQPYGGAIETPGIARLASRGVTFEKASTNASWTSPSVATMLSGHYPWSHRIGEAHGLFGRLHPDLPYLPELLAESGYYTLAILNNPMVSPALGYGRGFERIERRFKLRPSELERENDDPVAQADFIWTSYFGPMLAARGERPFFVYLHELDPHHPHEPPPPWDSKFATDGERSDADFRNFHAYNNNPGILSDVDVRHINALYNGEVGYMDAYLGRLMERLRETGLEEETLVVFCADHGEMIGDHQFFGHGRFVWEAVRRVPLILSLPGVLPEGARLRTPVQLVDLPPTILDLLGQETPASMQGRTLVPFVFAPQTPMSDRPTFMRAHAVGEFSREAVTFGRWKLVAEWSDKYASMLPNDAQRREPYALYDLAADPGERTDRSRQQPVVVHTLAQMLAWRRHLDRVEVGRRFRHSLESPEIDPAIRKRLRALGYAP